MLYRSGLQDYFLIQSQANDRFTNAFWQTHSSLLYCFLLLVSSGSNPLSGKYYSTSLSALSEQFDILRRHSTHFRVTITTIITSNDNRAQAHISTRCRLRLFLLNPNRFQCLRDTSEYSRKHHSHHIVGFHLTSTRFSSCSPCKNTIVVYFSTADCRSTS